MGNVFTATGIYSEDWMGDRLEFRQNALQDISNIWTLQAAGEYILPLSPRDMR
jgi:hypothetical protein